MSTIEEKAKDISAELGPKKSKQRFQDQYRKFMDWRNSQNLLHEIISQDELLVYFKCE